MSYRRPAQERTVAGTHGRIGAVRGIFHPFEAFRGERGAKFSATKAEEWPKEADIRRARACAEGRHSRDRTRARAPPQSQQDGFGLVISGMAAEDRGRAGHCPGCLRERRISGRAGGAFDAAVSSRFDSNEPGRIRTHAPELTPHLVGFFT